MEWGWIGKQVILPVMVSVPATLGMLWWMGLFN